MLVENKKQHTRNFGNNCQQQGIKILLVSSLVDKDLFTCTSRSAGNAGTKNTVMFEDPTEKHLIELAEQLSCPEGEMGVRTGERMAVNNDHMISLAVGALALQATDIVLEIGPGNGSHVAEILKDFRHLLYYGVDISELMVQEALKINKAEVAAGHADFSLSDGEKLNFADSYFSKVFTVNTLYFWKDPQAFLAEILRVLRPGGIFSLAFATKAFMQTLPFTKYNFSLYSCAEGRELLQNNGFDIIDISVTTEKVMSNAALMVDREVVVITAMKP